MKGEKQELDSNSCSQHSTTGARWVDVRGAVLIVRPDVAAGPASALRCAYAERAAEALTIVCERCGGGKRATLGRVFASPLGLLVAIEVTLPPRSALAHATPLDGTQAHSTPLEPTQAHVAGALPGWHKRGDDGAPVQIAALDEWPDDVTMSAYCARRDRNGRHGFRSVTVGALRAAVANARGRRILGV